MALDQQGHKASKEKQALKVPKVLRELQVQQVLRELQVQQVLRELQVQLAKTEPTGPLIRQTFYNKTQVVLLMMNTPSIGIYPGAGVNVWDNQQDLMRNLIGLNGISVSLHGDGDRITIDGSGISGLDPNYIRLANNLVTLSKNLVVNGGDDSQIMFSTSDGATSPGASLINDPYQNKFVLQLHGSDLMWGQM